MTGSLTTRVTAAAVVRVVSAAVVAAGVWASGAAALEPSLRVTSLRDFGVSRDPSLDDLVRPNENRLRDRQAERLGGLEVDHEFELSGLLDGEIGGFCALEDLVDVPCCAPNHVDSARTVRDEGTVFDQHVGPTYYRQPSLSRQFGDLDSVHHEK